MECGWGGINPLECGGDIIGGIGPPGAPGGPGGPPKI